MGLMRKMLLVVALSFAGCGARVEPDRGEGASSGVGAPDDSGVATTPTLGCPGSPPEPAQSCVGTSGYPGEVFYCHYFLGGARCARQYKCTNKGGSGTTFLGGTESCTFEASACDEGKECGVVFESSGACIVECTRVCMCNASTGRLACKPTSCPKK